jgi:predicted nucleic acid-binding protein
MAFKIILDTNIILDLVLERSKDQVGLKKFYASVINGDFKCYTTTAIIQTSSYWITKEKGSANAKRILLALLNDVTIIEATQHTVVTALQSNFTDIEDALQYYTALQHNVDAFISRDKDFIKSAIPQLPVYHPLEFIKKFI